MMGRVVGGGSHGRKGAIYEVALGGCPRATLRGVGGLEGQAQRGEAVPEMGRRCVRPDGVELITRFLCRGHHIHGVPHEIVTVTVTLEGNGAGLDPTEGRRG